jgi:UDP-N-acetylmuramate dehydrogenase
MISISENEPLSNHSTFRIGGMAKFFVMVKNADEIKEAIKYAEDRNLKYIVIGGGSNILFHDEGYGGVVIKARSTNIEIRNENTLVAEAGVLLSQVVLRATELGLTGMEWAIGIPGTVGGGVVGNCGAYGYAIAEVLKSVTVFHNNKIEKIEKASCDFCYRGSAFKNFRHGGIILEAEFELQKSDKEKVQEKIKEIIKQRIGRVPTQPSAGSVFKNILASEAPDLGARHLSAVKGGKVSVGYLIEQCGLKGKQIGGAQISPLHANFIVNTGHAKASEVLALIGLCQKEVLAKFGISLETEIVVI